MHPSALADWGKSWQAKTRGTEDHLFQRYATFKEYAKEINLEATFEEGPGKHEWRFWDTYIQKALVFFGLTDQGAGNEF